MKHRSRIVYFGLLSIACLTTTSCDIVKQAIGPGDGDKWSVYGNNEKQCTVIPSTARNPFYPNLLGTYNSKGEASSALNGFKANEGPCWNS